MAETFPVPIRGVGKPDYSKEVSLGQIRPGISLKYNQQLLQFGIIHTDFPAGIVFPYAIPYIQPVLAPGAISHPFHLQTMVATPYNLAVGYSLTLVEKGISFNQDCEVWLFFDGAVVEIPFLVSGGSEVDIGQISGVSTLMFDPTASAPHTIDFQIVNRGLGNMRGGTLFVAILEKM